MNNVIHRSRNQRKIWRSLMIITSGKKNCYYLHGWFQKDINHVLWLSVTDPNASEYPVEMFYSCSTSLSTTIIIKVSSRGKSCRRMPFKQSRTVSKNLYRVKIYYNLLPLICHLSVCLYRTEKRGVCVY